MKPTESPEQAAHRLASKPLGNGYAFEALHTYTTGEGEPLYWRIRLKNLATGKKWIRPLCLAGDEYALKERDFDNGQKPLYRLHDLASRPGDVVLVVEGEWCADKLASLGILAITSGAADSVSRTDWQPLAGRTVLIWPDNDDAGLRYANAVQEMLCLMDCTVNRMDMAALDLPGKGDAVDWLARNPDATAADIFSLPVMAAEISPDIPETTATDENEKISQASQLVTFVEAHAELFHDQNGDVYAHEKNSRTTWRIESRAFKDWLQAMFFGTTGKSVRDQSFREALSTMAGRGRIQGECRDVYVRVAMLDDCYFLDLGEKSKASIVKIRAGNWEVISDAPVMFLRPESQRALPMPESGGDLSLLWQAANIPKDCQVLVVAWLCECLRLDTPFPVLELIGEQGSAKSTTQTALRKLIDPNACDLRAAPKTVEDVYVSAGVNWLVSYENISHLSAPMQDAFCVLATGGGHAKRKLYSDADETVITVKRPVVINGISVAITAQDLVDRAITIDTPTITERMEMPDLWRNFEQHHGKILGALLDVMASALQYLPETHLPKVDRPRLAEFARFGMAVAKAMHQPPELFMQQFTARRQESIARTIDASPVATAVVEWFDKNPDGRTITVKEWMNALDYFKPPYSDAWPKTPKGLGDALRRAASSLRQMGIECRALPKLGGVIRWEIKPRDKSSAASPVSPASLDAGEYSQDIRTFKTSAQVFSSASLR